MKEAEILVVQKSFKRLLSVDKAVVKYFYSRVIEMDSDISRELKKELFDNSASVMPKVQMIVDALGDLKGIETELHEFGSYLNSKGFAADDYQSTGSAFVDTLAYGFGKDFSWEIQNAWVKMYKSAVAIMLEGALTK